MFFRRRPPRDRKPIGRSTRPVRRAALHQLKLAHQLFEQEQWPQAAEQFERIAQGAANRGLPQAARLYLRAGQARLENGDLEMGMSHLHQAVRLFAQFGQFIQLQHLRPRIVQGLNTLGLEREAAELNQEIHTILDQEKLTSAPAHSSLRFSPKYSACGGTLRPDEMEILDHQTGLCVYCGSVNYAS